MHNPHCSGGIAAGVQWDAWMHPSIWCILSHSHSLNICVCRLGLDLKCVADGQSFKTRLPFVRPAESRKDVKDVIVEMTRAAAAALQN
jgi:hypothetical protein